jgi:CRP-like cAMP-binding protein
MGQLLDTLAEVAFLRGSPREVVMKLLVAGRCIDARRGHRFWHEGDAPALLVVPVTGELKSTAVTLAGHELIDRVVEPGEVAGLHGLTDGMCHPTACEVSHAGSFFVVGREAFLRFLNAHPALREQVTAQLGCMYRQSLRDRQGLAAQTVSERLAAFLLEHACVRQGDGARVLLNLSQAEVAARLGTAREVVARAMADLADRGALARTDRAVFVQDWQRLLAAAGHDAPEHQAQVARLACDVQPEDRTRHFFSQAGRDWRGGLHGDAALCRGRLGDLAACVNVGCPAARGA